MKLVEGWRTCLKRAWSIRLAALFATLAAMVMANPMLLLGLIGFVPSEWRPIAAGVTFVVTFVVPTLARITAQPKLQARIKENKRAD
jgi:hypothetical protein